MGPLVNAAQRDRVLGFLTELPRSGARVLTGGGGRRATGTPAGSSNRPSSTPSRRRGSSARRSSARSWPSRPSAGTPRRVDSRTAPTSGCSPASGPPTSRARCAWPPRCSSGQVSVNQFADAGVIGFPFNMQKDSGFSRGGGYAAMREYTQEKAVAIRLLPPVRLDSRPPGGAAGQHRARVSTPDSPTRTASSRTRLRPPLRRGQRRPGRLLPGSDERCPVGWTEAHEGYWYTTRYADVVRDRPGRRDVLVRAGDRRRAGSLSSSRAAAVWSNTRSSSTHRHAPYRELINPLLTAEAVKHSSR